MAAPGPLLGLLALLPTVFGVESLYPPAHPVPPPPPCTVLCKDPKNYVCAYHPHHGYHTFDCPCALNAVLCSDSNWKLHSQGRCKGDKDKCPYHCTLEKNPVCGYNKNGYKTFPNKCLFNNANDCEKAGYELAYSGTCKPEHEEGCHVLCPAIYAPICAYSPSRGYKDFSSACAMGAENQCKKADYVEWHKNKCTKEELSAICKPDFCLKFVGSPVCGKCNGYFTFANLCFMYQRNICHGTVYTMDHKGPCTKSELEVFCKDSHYCDHASGPEVCATCALNTYQTFPNNCALLYQTQCLKREFKWVHDNKCTNLEVTGKCPLACTKEHVPVCAYSPNFGYKTFGNKCLQEAANGCHYRDYTIKRPGECTKKELAENCEKQCGSEYAPVCGVCPYKTYKTFCNLCVMYKEIGCSGVEYNLAHKGKCLPDEEGGGPCPYYCGYDYNPVCAKSPTHGYKTFPNLCILTGENKCNGGDYVKVRYGECTKEELSAICKPEFCLKDTKGPVCGVYNGYYTFANLCFLNRKNICDGKDYKLAHTGPCTKCELEAFCKKGPKLYCDTHGHGPEVCAKCPLNTYQTFPSNCVLTYENTCLGKKFTWVHDNKCTSLEVAGKCPLACTKEYDPVCVYSCKIGYKTFGNKCLLEAANACYEGDYKVKHFGECTKKELDENCKKECSAQEYKPVCGVCLANTYKTFCNLCTLYKENGCNGVGYKVAHKGKCTKKELGGSKPCPYTCTYEYKPVCAASPTHGWATFPNFCVLSGENKCNGGGYIQKHEGECTKAELSKICEADYCSKGGYKKVCGKSPSHGYHTFPNLCYMNQKNICFGGDYVKSHEDECTKYKLEAFCKKGYCDGAPCPQVCATCPSKAYYTFPSKCALYQEILCSGKDLKWVHDYKCTPSEVNGLCPHSCTEEYKPVCAWSPTIGYKTFGNKCLMTADNECSHGDFQFKRAEKCTEEELGKNCKKVCSTEYKPVCARSPSGEVKTFCNKCTLYKEMGCKGIDYDFLHEGKCPGGPIKPPTCVLAIKCSDEDKKVCAYSKSKKKFVTFQNLCQLQAENLCNYKYDYLLYHEKACTKAELENDCKRTCPGVYDPVCTKSPKKGYRTFDNLCLYLKHQTCEHGDSDFEKYGNCEKPVGPCDVIVECIQKYDPVCVFSKSKKHFKTFNNKCQFRAQNPCQYKNDYFEVGDIPCTKDELCPDYCKKVSCGHHAGPPVCAHCKLSGFVTLPSACHLALEIGCHHKDYTYSHSGACDNTGPPKCPKVCTKEINYQCGYSPFTKRWKKFPNKCELHNENECNDGDYMVVHGGDCTKHEYENNCHRTCPNYKDPICCLSPDGYKTITSVCQFILDTTCKRKDLKYLHDGPCKHPEGPIEGCPVSCPLDLKPICCYSHTKKTWKTFDNECRLKEWNKCKHGDYIFKHPGACETHGDECKSTCPLVYHPVCAKHYKGKYTTFPNKCELDAANNCNHAGYKLTHKGKCTQKELGGACSHICPLYYLGVCGYCERSHTYKTFANECFMDRENSCTNSNYKILHHGRCTPKELGYKCNRNCQLVYSPICCKSPTKNYRTYANFCLLDRENSCFRGDYNVVHKGECFDWETCKNCHDKKKHKHY